MEQTIAPTANTDSDVLAACISPASFWAPIWVRPESAWLEHAPFAFWLVGALRPRSIVELGTHSGYSYAVFCQAAQILSLDCRCYGVDNWKGDEYAGFYGEDVFRAINDHNERHYKSFSRLIRSDFNQALEHFTKGSIDLLHIDGFHSYEAVQSDYVTWRSRLSKSGVVLFHDTNVHELGFGVAHLWRELSQEHKNFQFLHGHGLGVLGVGEDFPNSVEALFRYSSDAEATHQIRQAYSQLGSVIYNRIALERVEAQLRQAREETGRERVAAQTASERLALIEASAWWRLGAPLREARRGLSWVARQGRRA